MGLYADPKGETVTTMPTGQNEERVTSENGGSKSGSELSRLRNRVVELENYLKKQVANYRHTLPTKKCHLLHSNWSHSPLLLCPLRR